MSYFSYRSTEATIMYMDKKIICTKYINCKAILILWVIKKIIIHNDAPFRISAELFIQTETKTTFI